MKEHVLSYSSCAERDVLLRCRVIRGSVPHSPAGGEEGTAVGDHGSGSLLFVGGGTDPAA